MYESGKAIALYKKLLVLFLLVGSLVLLQGCNAEEKDSIVSSMPRQEESYEPDYVDSYEGQISYWIKYKDNEQIVVVYRNNGYKWLGSGDIFSLERWEDGSWEDVVEVTEHMSLLVFLYEAEKHKTFTITYHLSEIYGSLKKGHYRISNDMQADTSSIRMFVEFDIV